jgi:geranylgeranyl reductase family protein
MPSDTIAIIGAGPAGAFAAESLGRAGRRVLLLDEKLAWEKPCGGGITHKALVEYPFLGDAQVARNWVSGCELMSPSGRRVHLALDRPIAIFSRRVLNGLLLERARQAGAEVIKERVTAISGVGGAWKLDTRSGGITASYIVLAAGARNPFRAQFSLPFAAEDLMATAGYHVSGTASEMRVRFLHGLDGYIWMFPRTDHYSAGICGKMTGASTAELRCRLEAWLREQRVEFRGAPFYSHLLPSPTAAFLRHAPVSGPGWAMVGDAAGFVDPITGEGLYYALRSADLLARALVAGEPQRYPQWLWRDFLPELETAAGFVERFFRGSFAGAPVLERMVQFAARSSCFRGLLCDIFAGSQGYSGLRRRAYCTLPLMLVEIAGSSLRPQRPTIADRRPTAAL